MVAVTEPRPSALHDLKRIPQGIAINKFDLEKQFCLEIEKFAKKEKGNIRNHIQCIKKTRRNILIDPANYHNEKTATIIHLLKTTLDDLCPLSWMQLHINYYQRHKEEVMSDYTICLNCIQLLTQRGLIVKDWMKKLKDKDVYNVEDALNGKI